MGTRRASAKVYNRMIRRLAGMKKQGSRAWERQKGRASAYRKRMISLNRIHPVDYLPTPSYSVPELKKKMPPKYRRIFDEMFQTQTGRKTIQRYKKFWKLPLPTAFQIMPDGPKDSGKKVPLVGMGYAPEVHISLARKGGGGDRVKIRGRWWVACDPVGRKIYLLTGKKPKLPLTGNTRKLSAIGYAPETHYIPTRDQERAGTHKAKLHWVHLHSDDGGTNPVIRADVRAGKGSAKKFSRARTLRQKLKALGVGRKTNFVYDRATYTVTDWIRR